MKRLAVDFHLHSTLSPCASPDMTPPNILAKAQELGFDAIVITDHNTMLNVPAFIEKSKDFSVKCLPGMEVQTKEDIHILCIFDNQLEGEVWQSHVAKNMPKISNKISVFGNQKVVNSQGQELYELEQMLLTGTNLSVDHVVKKVNELGGICIASHIDRQAFSLWGHLGFIPQDLAIAGVELTPHLPRNIQQIQAVKELGLGTIVSSDAHWLEQLKAPQTFIYVEELSVSELKLALKNKDGRMIEIVR